MIKRIFRHKGVLLLQLIVSFLLIIGLKWHANASDTLNIMNEEFDQEIQDLESYIDPNAGQSPVVYQKNSPIIVQSSALEDSPQEKMRRQRIKVEKETERKVFSKLENDRLKEEAKLRKKIMQRLEDKVKAEAPVVEASDQPVASTAPIVIDHPSALVTNEKKKADLYIAPGGGMNMFPRVYNIKPGFVGFLGFGARFKELWLAEVGASYSVFDISSGYYNGYGDNRVQEIAASLGVKRYLLAGVFRPVIGFSGIYRFRSHKDRYNMFSRFQNVESHGLDMGISSGVDFVLSRTLTIGVEVKYMMNLTNSLPMNSYHPQFFGYKLSDELRYFTFGLNAKVFL